MLKPSKLLGFETEILRNDILSVQVNLLNRCTSKCLSCQKYTWPNERLKSTDVYNLIDYLKTQGLQHILFSGGDPILYRDFGKLLSYCNTIGINSGFITTLIFGDNFDYEEIALNAYRIHVSLDAVDKDLYKKIRGVDSLENVKSNVTKINLIRALENKILIRFSMTVSNLNYTTIKDVYEYAKEVGCCVNFYNVHTFLDLLLNDLEKHEYFELLGEIIRDEFKNNKFITNAVSIAESLRNELLYGYDITGSCARCYMPNIHALINSNGDVYPCCKLLDDNNFYGQQNENSYGNICGKSIEEMGEIFNKRLSLDYPKNCTLCRQCLPMKNGLLNELEIIKNKSERGVLCF